MNGRVPFATVLRWVLVGGLLVWLVIVPHCDYEPYLNSLYYTLYHTQIIISPTVRKKGLLKLLSQYHLVIILLAPIDPCITIILKPFC